MLLACGTCSDALLDSRDWWLGGAHLWFLTLLVEGAVFGLITWAMKFESATPALARLALTLPMFIVGAGFGVVFALAVLVPAALWSLFRNFRSSPSLAGVRVAVLCAGLVAGLWQAWPPHRSADDLLDTAIAAARLRVMDSWIIDELRRRPDAVSTLERRGAPEGSTLELHATLGGAPEFRRGHCEWMLRERPKDPEVARICAL